MKELYLKTRAQWRNWLEANHNKSDGVWLVFYKKETGKPTLCYDDAVEEALCFGWIDSILKKRDEETYTRKLTPRSTRSNWSELNKRRVEKLIRQGLMAKPGLTKVAEARESGLWDRSGRPQISEEIPRELADALVGNKKAKAFFDQLAPSYKKQFIGWIAVAKRPETKARRVAESVALLEQGKKLGMK